MPGLIMLVCSECSNKSPCTCNNDEIRAFRCRDAKSTMIIRAEWREYIPGDQLYTDPQGEPYKGLTEFIQTPMSDPLKPKAPEELFKGAQAHKYKLRTEK